MIKAAVLFSGLPRCIDRCSDSHKEYFKDTKDIKFDYFIHTCETLEKEGALRDKLNKIYNPKSLLIEQQGSEYQPQQDVDTIVKCQKVISKQSSDIHWENQVRGEGNNLKHDLMQFYTWWRSGEVYHDWYKKHYSGVVATAHEHCHDIIFKMRFDLTMKQQFDYETLINKFDAMNNVIFFIQNKSPLFHLRRETVVNDTFFFGSTKLMSALLYSVYKNRLRQIMHSEVGCGWFSDWPEQALYRTLQDNTSGMNIPHKIITGTNIPCHRVRCDKANYSYLSAKGE